MTKVRVVLVVNTPEALAVRVVRATIIVGDGEVASHSLGDFLV